MEELTIKVPGKLMVAGEFAVLEPYEPLLVTAVDRYVYGSLTDAMAGELTLDNFHLERLAWSFSHHKVHIAADDNRLSFVQMAMETTLRYVEECGVSVRPFHLSIRSELDDGAGKKYGLGSSAAVSVTVVALLLRKFFQKADPYLVFQLASIAHVKVQGNGSGADIAASAYGGLLYYQSFQAEWLLAQMQQTDSVKELVEMPWTYVSIERVDLPEDINVFVGWTGSPASTGNLVHDILQLKETNPQAFQTFLQDSSAAVRGCVQAMKVDDADAFLYHIQKNRQALTALGKIAKVAIDTPALDQLSDIAEALGGSGKFSGAGGGDCGLAFMKENSQDISASLFAKWRKVGIEPLELKINVPSMKPI